MIEVMTDRDAWKKTINSPPRFGFYHTYLYRILSKKEDETLIFIKYQDEGQMIQIPLLIRPLAGTNYGYATSVYGCVGPRYGREEHKFGHSPFTKELEEFFKSNNMVSVFSRLHPYMDYQEALFRNMGKIAVWDRVIHIDLTLPAEIQRQGCNSRLKASLNNSKKSCSAYRGKTDGDSLHFIKLCNQNMRRVNASASYFFEERGFYKLLLISDFETGVLLYILKDTNEVIAGAIFIKTYTMAQYHLSGSSAAYVNLGAIKLMIDEMCKSTGAQKHKSFNLDSSKAKRKDSLFAIKSSFSKYLRPFKLWNFIVGPDIYKLLVERQLKRVQEAIMDAALAYFPAYRILPLINS